MDQVTLDNVGGMFRHGLRKDLIPHFLIYLLCFFLTLAGAMFGFRWDEHYLALGGLALSQSFIPYRDYSIPMGPVPVIFQSLGSYFFDSYLFKYFFSSALLNLLSIYAITRHLGKTQLSSLGKLGLSLVCTYSFFGATGAIWYNPLAAFFISIGLLLLLKTVSPISLFEILTSSTLASLALLSKQDYGILGTGMLLGVMIFRGAPTLKILLFLGLTASLTFGSLWLFKALWQADVFAMVNTLNNGYPSRLTYLTEAGVWRSFFWSENNLPRIAPFFLSSLAFIILMAVNSRGKKQPWKEFFVILSLTVVSAVTSLTSGKGAGFVSVCFFPALLACGLSFLPARYLKWANSVLLTLGVYFFFINLYDVLRIKDYVHPKAPYLRHYYFPKKTAELFDAFNTLIESDSSPLTKSIFLGGLFQFAHPKLNIRFDQGPLWIHEGITSKSDDLLQMIHKLRESKPAYVVDIWSDNLSMLEHRWGAARSQYLCFLKSYEKKLEGEIEVIGSGGMLTKVTIYKLIPGILGSS